MPIGSHVPAAAPLAGARERDAEIVQFFLSSPQSWRKPGLRSDADELRAAGLDLYSHAPYLVNLGSPNNRVRIPSRKILADTIAAAAEIGMRGSWCTAAISVMTRTGPSGTNGGARRSTRWIRPCPS